MRQSTRFRSSWADLLRRRPLDSGFELLPLLGAPRVSAIVVHGRIERASGIVYIMAHRIEDLEPVGQRLGPRSRNFHGRHRAEIRS